MTLYTSGLITTPTQSSPLVNPVTLVLHDSLLLPGNSYRFKLTMTDTLGRVGFAELDIRTESVPTAGTMAITPVTGEVLATLFSLRALGWTDDTGDGPFLYQLGLQYMCDDDDLRRSSGACVEWITGLSMDNQFSFILPDLDLSLNPALLLRVLDRNGAIQELSHPISLLLSPLANSSSAVGGVAGLQVLLAGIEELVAGGDWIRGLGELTSLLSTVELDHEAIRCGESGTLSPRLQLTYDGIVRVKVHALQVILDLYTFVPPSQTHHQIILSLLQKVTGIQCTTNPRNDSFVWPQGDTERVIAVLEGVVRTFNTFSELGVVSTRGLSSQDARIILSVYEQVLSLGVHVSSDVLPRVRSFVADAMLALLPDLAHGLCIQQRLHQASSSVDLDGFLNLKSSHINLPRDYVTGGCQGNEGCTFEPVEVDFRSLLFSLFLQWNCSGDADTDHCSGVCVTSTLFHLDVLWQGSQYSSHLKTPLLHLSLQNPSSGAPLTLQLTSSLPVLTFPLSVPYSSSANLACSMWDNRSLTWGSSVCRTEVMVSVSRVRCQCPDVGVLFYGVLELCPAGHYGEMCNESKLRSVF